MGEKWTPVPHREPKKTSTRPAVVTPLQQAVRVQYSIYSLLETDSSDDETSTVQEQRSTNDDWDTIMTYTPGITYLDTFIAEIKPVQNPTALDVIEFQQELGMALSMCGHEFGEGVGYSFLVEDIESYRMRIGDENAQKPKKPMRPEPPEDTVSSTAFKHYEYRKIAWQEWDKIQSETMQAIQKKFPTMLSEQRNRKYKWLPAKITPETAMKTIHNDVLTRKTARELYAGLTHQLMTTEYVPCRVGPAEFFQTMLDLHHRANSLGGAQIDEDNLMTWCLLAFRRSGHDKGSLTKLEEQWEIESNGYPAGQVLDKFIQYWKQRLAALYVDEQGTHHSAKLGERLSHIERSLRDEVSQLMENQEELASALQASTYRSSPSDMPSVINTAHSGVTTNTELINAFRDGIAAMTTQLRQEIKQLSLQATQLSKQPNQQTMATVEILVLHVRRQPHPQYNRVPTTQTTPQPQGSHDSHNARPTGRQRQTRSPMDEVVPPNYLQDPRGTRMTSWEGASRHTPWCFS